MLFAKGDEKSNSSSISYHDILHLAFIICTYLIFVMPVLKDPFILPIHDNFSYHMAYFNYMAWSLANGYGFPLWEPSFGGIPLGIMSISMFPFLPHRLLGYVIYGALPLDIVTIYKISLVLGMMITAIGWWFVLRRLSGSRFGASFGCLMVLLGGTGFTIFHQEQILATMVWMPWLLLALFQVKNDLRYIIVVAVLLGFSMTVHYPQIQLLTFLVVLVAFIIAGRLTITFLRSALKEWKVLLFSVVVFFLAASPSIYINSVKESFSSPLRVSQQIETNSLSEYMNLNKLSISSAPFEYLQNYVKPMKSVLDDRYAAYVTVIGIAFACLGLIRRFRAAIPIAIMLIFCLWASLGINGYLAQLLFVVRFPFIGYFRQWYHFIPVANFSLSALGAMGFAAILERFLNLRRAGTQIAAVFCIVVISGMYAEGKSYFGYYSKHNLLHFFQNAKQVSKPTSEEMSYFLRSGQYRWEFNREKFLVTFQTKPLLTYSMWYRMAQICPKAISNQPYFAATVYNTSELSPDDRDSLAETLCASGFIRSGVMADMPISDSGSSDVRVSNMITVKNSVVFPESKSLVKNIIFPIKDYLVTPIGASLGGISPDAGLVVFPFSYQSGLNAELNGRSVQTYPVYNGAFTGVVVPGGKFDISLSVPFSWYQASLIVQAMLLLFVVVFSLVLCYRRGGKLNPRQP